MKNCVWFVVCLLLISCTNSGRSYVNKGSNETLEIDILPNSSKMFVYRIGRIPPPDAFKSRTNPGAPVADIATAEQYRRGAKPQRINEEKIRENTAFVVSQSGYCRDGFFLLDRSLSPDNLWVRGECKESATTDDLHRFGAVKKLDAQAWNKLEQK